MTRKEMNLEKFAILLTDFKNPTVKSIQGMLAFTASMPTEEIPERKSGIISAQFILVMKAIYTNTSN